MTDWTRSTGTNGTMMIRDIQGKIQFWLKAAPQVGGYLQYRFTVNGVTDSNNVFDFKTGGDWQLVRQWTVSTTQTVEFYLYQTAGPSLGGPTNLSAYIDRNTIPEAPSLASGLITATSVQINMSDGDSNGGDPIDLRRVSWNIAGEPLADGTFRTIENSKAFSIGGLTPGAKYYFYGQTHNRWGWSAYGPRLTVQMLDEPNQPGVVKFSKITQIGVTTTFTDGDTGGTAITARQVGWSLSATGDPTTIVAYSGATAVTGLKPATKYYFRSRTKNSVGWSAWSASSTVTTLSGVRINVNGVWKNAVPYVKVNGVWKLVRPWGRQYGYWEETT